MNDLPKMGGVAALMEAATLVGMGGDRHVAPWLEIRISAMRKVVLRYKMFIVQMIYAAK